MGRQLRVYSASVHRPDERWIPEEARTGHYIALNVISEDLKTRPMHNVRITEKDALRLASELIEAVRNVNGDFR